MQMGSKKKKKKKRLREIAPITHLKYKTIPSTNRKLTQDAARHTRGTQ